MNKSTLFWIVVLFFFTIFTTFGQQILLPNNAETTTIKINTPTLTAIDNQTITILQQLATILPASITTGIPQHLNLTYHIPGRSEITGTQLGRVIGEFNR